MDFPVMMLYIQLERDRDREREHENIKQLNHNFKGKMRKQNTKQKSVLVK